MISFKECVFYANAYNDSFYWWNYNYLSDLSIILKYLESDQKYSEGQSTSLQKIFDDTKIALGNINESWSLSNKIKEWGH